MYIFNKVIIFYFSDLKTYHFINIHVNIKYKRNIWKKNLLG